MILLYQVKEADYKENSLINFFTALEWHFRQNYRESETANKMMSKILRCGFIMWCCVMLPVSLSLVDADRTVNYCDAKMCGHLNSHTFCMFGVSYPHSSVIILLPSPINCVQLCFLAILQKVLQFLMPGRFPVTYGPWEFRCWWLTRHLSRTKAQRGRQVQIEQLVTANPHKMLWTRNSRQSYPACLFLILNYFFTGKHLKPFWSWVLALDTLNTFNFRTLIKWPAKAIWIIYLLNFDTNYTAGHMNR